MATQFFPTLVGNDDLKDRLRGDVTEGHLSHAYILEGKYGSGRHTVARLVTAALACPEGRESSDVIDFFGNVKSTPLPCGECTVCRKILENNSPDVITVGIEGDKSSVGVDSIREVKDQICFAPGELPYKVFILEDADLMTTQAQNALLLSLEEPPEYVVFFLLCESSAKLLETVRSRAPTLRMARLDESKIESHLLRSYPQATALRDEDGEAWRSLLFYAEGSIGKAIELLDTKSRADLFALYSDVKELLLLLARRNRAEIIGAVAKLNGKRADVTETLHLLETALRDLILLKKWEGSPLCFFKDREESLELSTRFTSKLLFDLYDACEEALRQLERSSNVRLTLMNMMLNASLI